MNRPKEKYQTIILLEPNLTNFYSFCSIPLFFIAQNYTFDSFSSGYDTWELLENRTALFNLMLLSQAPSTLPSTKQCGTHTTIHCFIYLFLLIFVNRLLKHLDQFLRLS